MGAFFQVHPFSDAQAMKKHTFRPSLNDVLEDRLALSHAGVIGAVHVDHAHPTTHPVLKSSTVNDVNRKIDVAFAQFNKEYRKEISQLDRSGNETKFQGDLSVSANKLRQALDRQATRIPGGSTTLVVTLNNRVDSLLHDLATNTTRSSTDLIRSDQSGAHADVATYIHDEVAKGDFSLK
jgi:hypothetical protein